MADHGRLFDNFSERASHAHGGSYFDSGFGQRTLQTAHGRLYDLFGAPKGTTDAHGARYDDFGWQPMPAIHGALFDTDFQMPNADREHGGSTWFDVFRGGATQARVMVNGRDVEGTVIDVNREFATVRTHDGQTHECDLGQFLAFRTPNEHQAAPPVPASDAEAPSAHSADAHGGYTKNEPGEPVFSPDNLPSVVQEAPQGQYTEPRSGVPAGLWDTFNHLKALADELDVAKAGPKAHYFTNSAGKKFSVKAPSSQMAIRDATTQHGLPLQYHGFKTAGEFNGGSRHPITAEHPALKGWLKNGKVPHATATPRSLTRRERAVGRAYAGQFGKTADELDVEKEHIGWGPMVSHLKAEGHSQSSSEKIAGYINARKHHLGKFGKSRLDAALDVLKVNNAVEQSAEHAPFDPNEFHEHMDPGDGSAVHATHKASGCPVWLLGSGRGHSLCPSVHCKTGQGETAVHAHKSVDATETAAQGAPNDAKAAKTVGHRSNCPRGGSGPCGSDEGGKCSMCGYQVRDHEAVGKAFGAIADALAGGQTTTVNPDKSPGGSGQATSDPPDVPIPHRDHKTSDHHMQLGRKPGVCPHCGGVIEDLDRIADQGAPSRAHKCIGSSLDILKALA